MDFNVQEKTHCQSLGHPSGPENVKVEGDWAWSRCSTFILVSQWQRTHFTQWLTEYRAASCRLHWSSPMDPDFVSVLFLCLLRLVFIGFSLQWMWIKCTIQLSLSLSRLGNCFTLLFSGYTCSCVHRLGALRVKKEQSSFQCNCSIDETRVTSLKGRKTGQTLPVKQGEVSFSLHSVCKINGQLPGH